MKKINLFSRLWSSGGNSQSSDVGSRCRVVADLLPSFCRVNHVLTLLVVMLFTIGVGNAWGAEDDTAYTLTCTQNSSNTTYASSFNVTINSKNWSAPGNQNAGSGWRVGGAKGTNVSRYITGKSTIDKPIKKITVNHNGRSNANLTINSFSVTVSQNSDFSSPIETKTVTSPSVSSAGSFDLTPTSSPWPSGCYYKFTLVYTHNKGSNYGLDLTSLVFVEGASGGGISTCATPTFSPAAGTYSGEQSVTISSTTTGSTIYYTTDGTNPTTSSSHGTAGAATASVMVSSSQTLKAIAVKDGMTTSATGSAAYTINIPYAVSFSTGTGNPTVSSRKEASAGAGITLPSVTPTCSGDGWSFAGWKETSAVTSETTVAPTLLSAGSTFHPTGNVTLYAVYKKAELSTSYEKITSSAALTSGSNYVIARGTALALDASDYHMDDGDGYFGTTSITVSDNTIANPSADLIWEISGNNTDGYSFYNANQNLYIGYSTSDHDLYADGTKHSDYTITYTSSYFYVKSKAESSYYFATWSYSLSGGGSAYFFEIDNSSAYVVLYKQTGTITYFSNPTCQACVAPDHVDISGRWDRFGGETISLTATPYDGSDQEITTGITGYQWQKYYNSTWNDIAGATSATYTKSNCDKDDSGSYRCQVSTGATCTTASAGFQVKVYVLECYTGGTTIYNFTRIGDTQAGTCQITLAAGNHTFKFHADNDYYGNNGTINEDVSGWVCSTSQGDLTIAAGLGGTFTISMEYSTGGNSSVEGEPEISVTYPRKDIFFSPGVWNVDGAKFAFYYFRDGGSSGWTDFITPNDCGSSAEIPQWNGVKIDAVRLKNTCSTPNWGDQWDGKQTNDITVTSDNYITITGWNRSDFTYGTYSTPTYTISYAAGTTPNKSGTAIIGSPSADSKTCGTAFTLPNSAQFTVTGYAQTGWTTSDGSAQTHALGGSYTTNAAQTFYPVWTANNCTITLHENGGAAEGTASVDYDATALTSITPVTRLGYTLTGYWTLASGGDKVLEANGDFSTSAPAAYVSSGYWKQASNCELYAQWVNANAGKVFDLVTDLSELGDGKEIVILGYKSNTETYYAMSTTQNNNNRASVVQTADEFTLSNNDETVTLGANTTVQVITLEETVTTNMYSLHVENGYLYAAGSSNNNYLRTQANTNDNSKFTFALANGDFTVIATNSSNNPDMRFNAGNNPPIFSCYATSTSQTKVRIYVEHETCDDTFDALELSTTANDISTVSGYNTVTLSTEGGNGGTVNYSVSPSSGWSIVGSTFTATAAGTYTVTASQLKNGDKCRATSNSVTITATTPALTPSTASLAFGEACTSHDAELTFTLTGSNLLGNVTLTLGGTNPGDFSVTSPITPTAGAVSETVTVTCTPSSAGSKSATLTISSTGVDAQTIDLSCTGVTCYDVEWYANGGDPYETTGVKSGEKPVFPSNPASCESGAGKSTYFYGWATDEWNGKAETLEDSKLSGITIYRKASDMPAVSAAGTKYYAVWAKADGVEAPATYAGTGTFTQITTLDELEVGAHYVLYGTKDDDASVKGAMNNTFTVEASGKNVFGASAVTISDNQITNPVAAIVWTLGGTTDEYTLYSQNSSKYVEIIANDTRGYSNPSEATTSFTISVNEGNFKIISNHSSANSRMITIYTASVFRSYSYLTEGYTLNLYKFGTTLTFSNFMTNCCNSSGLAFTTYEQEVVRQDLGGAKGTHKIIELPFATSSTGTYTVDVRRMGDTYGSRNTAQSGYSATDHTSISVDTENKKVVLEVWSVNVKNESGQWTYRVKLDQAATDVEAGDYCATTAYCFIDVVLRDKFVDNVNGNATVNRDGKGVALNTPTEGEMDIDKDDDCGGQTRRLLGWIKETDLMTIYGTPRETGKLDDAAAYEDNKSMIVAPGTGSFITTGVTWYAVWGTDNTPEP